MYLKRLIYENVGPIESANIRLSFKENGDPKPVILVGENGSGKSTIISNIADSLYEIAGQHFSNATTPTISGGHNYFKTILPNEVRAGSSCMYSLLQYKDVGDDEEPVYICKSGNITIDDIIQQCGIESKITGNEFGNEKKILASAELAKKVWKNNVICYFGPNRYERPVWLGDSYYTSLTYMHPAVNDRFDGHLDNPIMVQDVTNSNLQWLLDVIADSRCDTAGNVEDKQLQIVNVKVNDLILMRQARENLEEILSIILGKDVFFKLNLRNSHSSRFCVVEKEHGEMVCPSLDSLSTGQSALFNIFATIVRYADNNNINSSIQLNGIKGIVIIDEIELHLHSKLQKEALPKLIAMFPGIQFIITSHSPLFLLGMREELGETAFDVYEMPDARKIDIECFSEFDNAYSYIKKTQKFNEDIQSYIQSIPIEGKPLIITEGSTDWKYMDTALSVLSGDDKHKELFSNLDIEFLEYEPGNTGGGGPTPKFEMGKDALKSMCESLAKLPNKRRYIFIADCDSKDINNTLGDTERGYKHWGNNVYSLTLPIPQNRQSTPDICIEHYFSDDEIKTEIEIAGVKHRLYMCNEFDKKGYNSKLQVCCEGPKEVTLIVLGSLMEAIRKKYMH